MLPTDPPSGRLESWKEIATYLGRSVTTVQRWERYEGLPVHRQEHQALSSVYAIREEIDAWREGRTKAATLDASAASVPVIDARRPSRRALLAGGAGALCVAAAGTAWLRERVSERSTRPLFNSSMSERTPTVSADGRRVLYSELAAAETRFRLWNRADGTNRVVGAWSRSLAACQPRISPDGRRFAYLTAASENRWDVKVRSLDTGAERDVARLDGVGLDWSPDSETLAVTTSPASGGPVSVYTVHPAEGTLRLVSRPAAASWGDIDVAASPDGMHLAALRYTARGDGDVWLLSWDGRIERRLTSLHTWINGVSFTPDGAEILFSAVGSHLGRIYRVSIDGGKMHEVSTPGAVEPMFARAARGLLLFQDRRFASRIYRATLKDGVSADPQMLTSLVSSGEYCTLSPDGEQVAWCQSDGIWIWKSAARARRLPPPGPDMRDLAWSADARWLAVTARTEGDWRVWMVDAATGEHRRLTDERAIEGRPGWSESGAYIYWRSSRGGEIRYFRRRWPEGGEIEPVSPPATHGAASHDDRHFYYLENDQRSRIFEAAVSGASKPRLLQHIPPVKPQHWLVRGSSIVYADVQAPGAKTPVYRASIDGGQPELLFQMSIIPDHLAEFDVSPDFKTAVASISERQDDVWIVENFES